MSLIRTSFNYSRTVLLALMFILITGSVAYNDIPKESEPDIDIPIIYVTIRHDGISPEDAERLLIRPIEQELKTIEGIKEMRSTGYEGGANVLLEFDAGFDSDSAMRDVREGVDLAKGSLPAATDDPEIHEVNFSLFPVVVVILSGDAPDRALYRLARELKDAIEGIGEVLQVKIAGDRDEVVQVIVDPLRLESYGLDPALAAATVSSSNMLVAAGVQDTGQGRFSIKVPGLFESVMDIADLPVLVDGDAVVTVGDIADVRRTFRDPETHARVNGKVAVALEVSKRSGENVIATIEKVRAVVAAHQTEWPQTIKDSVQVNYSQDRSDQIRTMLSDLQNSVISAVILVMIVVIAALGVRSGLLVGLAIPGSFLAALLTLYLLDVSLNIVVLFSLILAVGMLVDGAIVVTEFADRKLSEGLSRREAYLQASGRMAAPIIASTATTLAAFLPLVFWPGVVGEFMKFLPMTVLITLGASLAMALIFVPVVGSLIGRPSTLSQRALDNLNAGEAGDLSSVAGPTGVYLSVLRWAVIRPKTILASSVVLLIGMFVVYGQLGPGVEFFPDVEPDNAQVQVRARGNLSIEEQNGIMRNIERRVLDVDGVRTFYTRVGADQNSEEAEDIVGSISLEFGDWRFRPRVKEIFHTIRERVADLAGVVVDLRKEEGGPPVGKPIQIQLSSYYPELLEEAAAMIRTKFDETPGLAVNTQQGAVPVSNFVKREAEQKTGRLRRVDGFRVITVKADVEEGVLADTKLHELQAWLADHPIDPRIQVVFKGEDEEQAKAKAFLGKAFMVALFLMALILITQFNSFYQAALILFAVVMSTVGVLLGLMLTGSPFGIVMNGIGVIALAGIVVNNNIVLIDTYARLRETIGDPIEAVLRTGVQRLRPVMLTTVTTILGLLPMMLGINIDFITREVTHGAPSTQWWTQLSTSIVFGLGFATILTLVVTPSALILQANLSRWWSGRRQRSVSLASS
ncbi:MAG: efflux RND transporter permease subunit [Gammaproteobacteria bacterium]|nr:efflux RND transporter permease subunit [Gammaproteobacteria bacterium]